MQKRFLLCKGRGPTLCMHIQDVVWCMTGRTECTITEEYDTAAGWLARFSLEVGWACERDYDCSVASHPLTSIPYLRFNSVPAVWEWDCSHVIWYKGRGPPDFPRHQSNSISVTSVSTGWTQRTMATTETEKRKLKTSSSKSVVPAGAIPRGVNFILGGLAG